MIMKTLPATAPCPVRCALNLAEEWHFDLIVNTDTQLVGHVQRGTEICIIFYILSDHTKSSTVEQ